VTVWAKKQTEWTKANNLEEKEAGIEVENAESIIECKNYFRGGNLNDLGTN